MQVQTNIFEVLEREDISYRENSKGARFRCPFHQPDRNPSAFAYRDSDRFICFTCGEKGDVIDFIMKLRGLSFKETLAYLGIEGDFRGQARGRNSMVAKKRVLAMAFREWEKTFHDELCTIYRAFHKVLSTLKTMEEVEKLADLYHQMPLIEHRLNILSSSNDRGKLELYRELDYGRKS